MRKADVSNRIKLLEDVVAAACRFDDSQVVDLRARKIQCEDVRTEVDIWDKVEEPF
jgi:Holliday junction resolvase RusA-like endonuclease